MPSVSDGDRKYTTQSMRDFGLYQIIDAANLAVDIPIPRITLALSYMHGRKVDDWVLQQRDQLALRCGNDQANQHTSHS